MGHQVVILVLSVTLFNSSISYGREKKSIFPWSSETEVKDADTVPGYLPTLKVHKYQGVQINPINGPPVYLPSIDTPASANEVVSPDHFQSAQLPPEYSQQLELLNKVAAILPEEGRLQGYDFTSLLPYVDLISEDDLARIEYTADAGKTTKPSKLLKVIGFLKALKAKKLEPFKVAANYGIGLLNKKKEAVNKILHLGQPAPSTPSSIFPLKTPSFPELHPGFYPPTLPAYFIPNRSATAAHRIQTAADGTDAQQLQQLHEPLQLQQQPAGATSNVKLQNKIPSLFVQMTQPGAHPQIPEASIYTTYPHQLAPAAAQNEVVESVAIYENSQPFALRSYSSPHLTSEEASSSLRQNPVRIHHDSYPDEPFPSKSSNVLTYQAPDKAASFVAINDVTQRQKSKIDLLLTQANAYPTRDLAASASENVEKVKENLDDVHKSTRDKEESSTGSVENHLASSSPRPKVTKLRPIATKPPVMVFPEMPVGSKVTDTTPIKKDLPATSLPSHKSSQ